jgi:hypothetical protein
MARLRMTANGDRYSLTVRGHLSGKDLGRLERLCGPALESRVPPLTLRLAADTTTDPPARAYLARLAQRGAVVQIE